MILNLKPKIEVPSLADVKTAIAELKNNKILGTTVFKLNDKIWRGEKLYKQIHKEIQFYLMIREISYVPSSQKAAN